jgi:heat-inducible transcriptional repressor
VDLFGAPLTERQVGVLLAIVQEHVRTREPVGSRVVQERYGVSASTATIRNDMAELEQAGYLHQPHTSAGRVPCDVAYRLYVNCLPSRGRLGTRQLPWLQGEYRRFGTQPHELLRATSRLLARAAAHPAVVTEPPAAQNLVTRLSLQPVSASTVVLSYRTSDGEEHSHLLKSEAPLTAELLAALSATLQRLHVDRELSALAAVSASGVQRHLGELQAPEDLLAGIRAAAAMDEGSAVYVDGTSYILDEPEFEERSRLKQLMQTLDEDAALRQVMRDATETSDVVVTIGSEHRHPGMRGCSLVASAYTVRGLRGAVGVLGPTRMDYAQIMDMVEFAARQLTETFALSPPSEQ